MDIIRDPSLVTVTTNLTKGCDYVIQSGIFLSDAITKLPAGIIDKTNTGIGGTSCELDARRDSIVVETLKETAEAKARKRSYRNNYEVFCYGTSRSSKNRPRTKNLQTKRSVNISLEGYIHDCRQNGQPLKITCVTDRLPSLRVAMNNYAAGSFDTCHLVLDEIDSLQEQSNFRDMESCFDIYKQHDEGKRTMISATLMKFHDKALEGEPLSKISQVGSRKLDIIVVDTSDLLGELITRIEALRRVAPQDKIVVACNHVGMCLDIIEHVQNNAVLKSTTLKLLCSKSKSADAGQYFGKILSNGMLPAQLNLFTSAYFNGFDLNERCHLFILADNLQSTLRLSPGQIYQVSGRCRPGLLSNQLLVKITPEAKFTNYTIQDLLSHAKEKLVVDEAVRVLSASDNKLSRQSAIAILNVFEEGTVDYPSIFKKDVTGIQELSYLKIDSFLEELETRKKYADVSTLQKFLSQHFSVTQSPPTAVSVNKKKQDKTDPTIRGQQVLSKLKRIGRSSSSQLEIDHIKKSCQGHQFMFERRMCDIYSLGCWNDRIDLNKLVTLMDTALKTRTYAMSLYKLWVLLAFHKCCKISPLIRTELAAHFRVGDSAKYTDFTIKAKKFVSALSAIGLKLPKSDLEVIRALKKQPTFVKDCLLTTKTKGGKLAKSYEVTGYAIARLISK